MNKLKCILDTNVLLVSISSKSKYHWIFKKLTNRDYEIFITNEILMEYEEIISLKFNQNVAKNVVRTLLLLPNVTLIDVFYNWNLIEHDKDDNKFVDCFVVSNADYIITNDKHFNVLKKIDFPKVNILNVKQFEEFFS